MLPRTSDLRLALKEGCTWFQRYLPSPKVLVRWRRTKPNKAYILGSEDASRLDFENWEVARDKGVCAEECIETVMKVVEREVAAEERLEEAAIVVCKEVDGKRYVVDVLGIRVSRKHGIPTSGYPASVLLTALQTYELPPQLKPPHIHPNPKQCPHKPKSPDHRPPSAQLISQCLTRVSAHFDEVLTESRELRKEFGIVMKVQLANYPKDVLDHVIRKVYERILADPRLSRFYPNKARIQEKLESSVKSVFQNGLSRNMKARMREVHMGMGISEVDFSLYVRYFAESLREMDVTEVDVAHIVEFLDEFRDEVVQARLDQAGLSL